MGLFNITDQIRNALKADLKKHPDVLAGLEKIDTGCKALQGVLSRLSVGEITAALVAVNTTTGKKFSDAEISVAASEIAQIPEGLKQIEALVESAEKDLQ
jgi:hypothetical protein